MQLFAVQSITLFNSNDVYSNMISNYSNFWVVSICYLYNLQCDCNAYNRNVWVQSILLSFLHAQWWTIGCRTFFSHQNTLHVPIEKQLNKKYSFLTCKLLLCCWTRDDLNLIVKLKVGCCRLLSWSDVSLFIFFKLK